MIETTQIDAIGQIVKDIIDLKYECSNLQRDATMENMYAWYSWALQAGLIEVTYKYGELQGFLEWNRLSAIPKTRDDANALVDYDIKGPILYVANCCVKDDQSRHGVLWKLVHQMKEKNKDLEYACWHEGSDKNLRVYKRKDVEGGISNERISK